MYGLWNDKSTFQSTKQVSDTYGSRIMAESKDKTRGGEMKDTLKVDRDHFRKVYFEKTYMEELLKMKNMINFIVFIYFIS